MDDLKIIDTRRATVRAIVLFSIVVAILFSWFAVRWQIGNLLAALTRETDPNLSAVADIAMRWAPGDPSALALKAAAGQDSSAAIASLEDAVRRAPFDYRWRIDLGRSYEQDGQVAKAGEQFERAVEIAPSYSSAHWHLGNFYLRQDQLEKALVELKTAAENNITYREQVFSLVWDFSGKDARQMESIAGERPDLVARLAYFFAARGRAEDSLRNWNRLTEVEKLKNTPVARAIALGLFDQRHYPQALEFAKQYGSETDATAETITNGSFEKQIGDNDESRFGWSIVRNDPKFEAVPDNRVKHDGNRSLRIGFKGYNKPSFANIFQTVVVEPNRKYKLRFWVRTENLRSAGMPMIEIINANDDNPFARSRTLSSGSHDWEQIEIDVSTPPNCNGITIRTIREFCGEECPIAGTFWYDDFELGIANDELRITN